MDAIIVFCARYVLYILGLLAFVYWLTVPNRKKISLVIFFVVTCAVAYILAKIGGAIFYDARPFVTDGVAPLLAHANNNGFPSDHTLLSSVIAVTVFYGSKAWGIGIFALALVVGMARILAHVHRPIDILGSIAFALIGGLAAYYLTPKIVARFAKNNA